MVDTLGGLWQTEEAVMEGVDKVKKSGRGEGKVRVLAALKCQISYRRQILGQPVFDKADWYFSENGVVFDNSTITSKLLKLITQDKENPNAK